MDIAGNNPAGFSLICSFYCDLNAFGPTPFTIGQIEDPVGLQMFKKLTTFNSFKPPCGPFPIKKLTDGIGQLGTTDSFTGTDDLLYLINFIAVKGSSTKSHR